jgi:hypothetical protein
MNNEGIKPFIRLELHVLKISGNTIIDTHRDLLSTFQSTQVDNWDKPSHKGISLV